MELKGLLTDDTAVSPVIGVILMVAITVILAAVVGSFALGIPDQAKTETTVPQTSFTFEYDSSSGTSGDDLNDGSESVGELTITLESGETVEPADIEIQDDDGDGPYTLSRTSELTAGASIDVTIGEDDTVRVIYAPADVDTSGVLAEYEAPGV